MTKIVSVSIDKDFEAEWKKFCKRYPSGRSQRIRQLIELDNKDNYYDDLKRVQDKRRDYLNRAENLKQIEAEMVTARQQETLTQESFENSWSMILQEINYFGSFERWVIEGTLLANRAKLLNMSQLELRQKVQRRLANENFK